MKKRLLYVKLVYYLGASAHILASVIICARKDEVVPEEATDGIIQAPRYATLFFAATIFMTIYVCFRSFHLISAFREFDNINGGPRI